MDVRCESLRGYAEAAEKLLRTDIPRDAKKEYIGDVVIIQWISDEDMADENVIKTRLAIREQWLAKVLDATNT